MKSRKDKACPMPHKQADQSSYPQHVQDRIASTAMAQNGGEDPMA